MEKYEQLKVIGEGSYGLVIKCRHRETDQVVAVKKFFETEDDATVRRMALREIRMLKKLKHENLVAMIEVFRHRKRFYLVFEYLMGTILDELNKMPNGLGEERTRERIFQVIRAVNYCHFNRIIHRDVKPENVLVSSLGVVKLCDFGFARLVTANGEPCTEYVATRWYRAPELLVIDQQYGTPVDIWAIGCLFAEMKTGDPIFPGESDIDQLYLIIKMLGKPCARHQHLISKSNHLKAVIRSATLGDPNSAYKTFSNWSLICVDFLMSCLKMDPQCRMSSGELLKHNYFTHDHFPQKFLPALREKVLQEFNKNPLLRRHKADILLSTDRGQEMAQRKVEPSRWKMSLGEGSIKRKFSCDTISCSADRSSNNFNRSNINRSSFSQKATHNLMKQGSVIRKANKYNFDNKTSQTTTEQQSLGELELQILEKTMEGLPKHSQNRVVDNLITLPAAKENRYNNGSVLNVDSSPKFQSLQLTDYVSPSLISSHNSEDKIRPSVNNIVFSKKSPKVLQNVRESSMMNVLNQVPLVHPPRGQQYMKKLDRNVVFDSMFTSVEPAVNSQNVGGVPHWLTNAGIGGREVKKEPKKQGEFTLPNLPGALTTPVKATKKSQITSDEIKNPEIVTPRV